MKSTKEIQRDLVEEFEIFDDWMSRYEYVIDLGKGLQDFPEEWKTETNKIQGCQSQVWINMRMQDDVLIAGAGIGGLAYAGIPVTHRDVNQSVTFVTGHDQSGETPGSLDWQSISKGSQVLVIYMGMKHIGQISQKLLAAGRPADEPVAVVTTATTADQGVLETTLGSVVEDIAKADLQPPAIICVGRAALMRQVLDWQGQAAGQPPRNLDPLGRGRPAESA